MNENIKKLISDTQYLILFFGNNLKDYNAVAHIVGGVTMDEQYDELALLFVDGKYFGYNFRHSIELFKIDFAKGKARYRRFISAGREPAFVWKVVDFSGRKVRVV